MDYKIVTFDDIYQRISIPNSFWGKVRGMDDESYKSELRNNLFWSDGFLEQLKGLPLEEQMKYYGISENVSFSKSSYGKIDSEKNSKHTFQLAEYQGLKALIVEADIIIGVCIETFLTDNPLGTPAFPYQNICTYIASDNNGSGNNDREDYAHLFCIKKVND